MDADLKSDFIRTMVTLTTESLAELYDLVSSELELRMATGIVIETFFDSGEVFKAEDIQREVYDRFIDTIKSANVIANFNRVQMINDLVLMSLDKLIQNGTVSYNEPLDTYTKQYKK